MKYILSVTLLLFTMLGASYAQDDKSAIEFKNEGNAALKANDYKTALASYEAALNLWDEAEDMDAAMVYNTATCARKIGNSEKSLKYYTQSKELAYKEDVATYYIATAYKDMGKDLEMENTLLAGIEEFPNSKYIGYMKKELANYYVKQSNEFYVSGAAILNTRVEGNRKEWDAIKENANVDFAKANELADKAIDYDATNTSATTIKSTIEQLMKN